MLRALLAAGLTLVAATPAQARPGELDPTFGDGGVVTIPGRAAGVRADAVAVQADGRIVAAGDDGNSFLAVRLLRSGAGDRGFGVRGRFAARFAGSTTARAREVALFRDGRVLLAGTVEIGGVRRFGVARLLPRGDLDPSFGTDGVAVVGPAGAELEGMALGRDGELVLAGSVERSGQRPAALVMRLLPDADPDPGFGAAGVADLGGFAGRARDVLVLADGAVAVALAGERGLIGPGTFFAARLTAAGTLDRAFGGGGIATVPTTRSALRAAGAAAIVPGPGGRLVLAGTARGGGRRHDATLVRLDPGGTPDPRFGRAGVARLRAPRSRSVRVEDMARDRSGRLVLGGRSGRSSVVMRVRANGRRDWLFTAPLGEVRGVAVERDRDIVSAGTIRERRRSSLVVARLRGR